MKIFIDTYSKFDMERSLFEYFKIDKEELLDLFYEADRESNKGSFTDGQIFNDVINSFIETRINYDELTHILFFHLSRRLNDTYQDSPGLNLYELLTKPTAMSLFLKDHGVVFEPEGTKLNLLYNGRPIPLDDNYKHESSYLRWRLGHTRRIDFCFNGFMLKDQIYKNHYARDLAAVPEFINVLANYLGDRNIGNDYIKNSEYFCFEYCVPIEKVIFDSDDYTATNNKPLYAINRVLNRLHDYYAYEERYVFDHDNPILRLRDDDIMEHEYFVTKEKISHSMLK
jgi:hypothetical protein